MKQEATKKSKKLIWLIAGLVALLLVVGAVLAILLLPSGEQSNEPTGPVGGRPDLYWNVDRQLYVGNEESAGLSTREPGEDGLYHIRLAYNGELVEYTFADKRLVNVIDSQDVVGLSFDASGNPVDAIDPATIATEVAKSFFVVTNKNGTLTLNSSIAMNGMQLPTPVGELTQIYDVRVDAPNPGAFAEVEAMDKVVVYANDKGETTHVYIVERQPEADIYWRVDKMYDSTKKETTRVPDENGVYTITFAKDGKHVDLYSKDKALVTDIDSKGVAYNAPKGLQVDENNFIVSQMDPVVAIRGKLAGSEYHVTEMNGTQITATHLLSGKEQGKTFTVDVPEDCPVYNVCVGGSATMIGEPTEIQMYDRVIVYTDLEGKPVLVFVMYRMANTPMYWNIERKYNSTTGETAREPVNGYYVFKMAVGGKQVTLRTKDKNLASQIDSFSYFMCGLEVEGDIIKRVYKPVYVSGNDYYGAGGVRYAVETIGSILSFVTISSVNWSPSNLVMRADVEIYDVTGYPGTKIGEKTTYNPGDTIRVVADYNDNITHIYVTARYTGKPIFYNFARKFNATLNETTRVVAAEGTTFAGYYVYKMASQGKTYTVVTDKKNIANIIDAQNAPIVALDTRKITKFVDAEGNVIPNVLEVKMAYEAITSLKFGEKQANYRRFLSLENGTMSTMIESTGVTDQWKVAEDVVIYNCSTVYTKNRGEKVSSLQYWDQIQGVATKQDGTIKEIYIMKRQAPSKFYYNGSRRYDSVNEVTTRKRAEEGQPYAGYYVYDLTCEGKSGTYITDREDIANTIDSFNYVPFGLTVKVLDKANNVYLVTQAFDATSIKGVKNVPASNYDVTKINGKNLTVTRYLPTATNIGAQIELKLADNYKAYDVSSYAENYGGKVKLGLGDRAYFVANMDGEVEWIYIWYKNTHQKGYMSHCPHCNKTVYWQPYSGNTYFANGADNLHLYVTDSAKKRAQATHGKAGMDPKDSKEVILDLNGQTLLVSSGRNFLVYAELTILDTVGGGKIQGSTDDGIASGGAIMIRENGVVNLLSGTLTENPLNNTNANGGVVYMTENATLNIKGGAIEGGTATTAGGNIYVAGKATVNMTGGTVAGDFEVVSKDATIRLGGNAKITNGKNGGLILPEGIVLPLDKITPETKVCVTAKGAFTAPAANIEQYLNNFYNDSELFPVVVKDGVLVGGRLSYCQHCEKDVYWTPYGGKAATGHFILMDNLDMVNQITIGSHDSKTCGKEGAKCNHDVDMVLDLNGYTISTGTGDSAYSRFALVYAGLTIMDTSEAKTGKIIATKDGPTLNAGLILASTGSKLKIYGGELTMAEGVTAAVGGVINLSGRLEMYGGKITNGTVGTYFDEKAGYPKGGTGGNLHISAFGVAYIYGGEISGGTAVPYVMDSFDGETGKTTKAFGQDAKGNNVVAVGGNIYSAGKLYIGTADGTGTGAVISGGKAPQGGNIYAAASFTVYKDGKIVDGTAVKAFDAHSRFTGGNVYLDSGRATIMGEVVGGKAYSGGNFACTGGTRVYLDGGKIVDGEATHWAGGNYFSNNGILQMINGAVVSGGKAYGMGGNVYAANGGELQMADSTVSGGTSTSNHASNKGGGNVYLQGRVLSGAEAEKDDDGFDYAVLTATNSTISGGVASKKSGGNIYALDAKVTMTDCVLSDGKALPASGYEGGGNIYARNDSAISKTEVVLTNTAVSGGETTRYGGSILVSNTDLTLAGTTTVTGGKTQLIGTVYSGNICRWNAGTLDIQAGVVVSDGLDGEGSAADVYANNGTGKSDNAFVNIAGTVKGIVRINDKNTNLTVSGDAKIGDLDLKAGVITAKDLTENAEIVVRATGSAFTNAIEPAEKAEEYAKYFKDKAGNLDCVAQDGKLYFGIVAPCAHCDGNDVLWSAFSAANGATTGHWVVVSDLELKTQLIIGSTTKHDVDSVIDLNGHTITAGVGADGAVNDTGRFALVYGKLSIIDNSAAQTGKIVAGRNEATSITGGLILASTGSTVNLYSGSLENAGNYTAGAGGLVRAINFNMYGGKLVGGIAKENNGGNLYVTGTANIYGGEILGGTATPKVTQVPAQGETPATTTYENGLGGNVYCSGVLNIAGGTISGGNAYNGGNVFQNNLTKHANITAGTITDGKATNNGGNIYHEDAADGKSGAQINIGKEAVISNGTAGNNGGNIYADYTISVLGKVTGGTAGKYGGNIWGDATIGVGSSTDATVAAEVSGGTATAESGGNIYSNYKLHVYKGATVSGGTARNGGNIGISGELNVYGTVSGGVATAAGGNITGAGGSKINIIGGTVTGGNAGTTGGNIQSNNGYINLTEGATVSDGTAATNGGNIYTQQHNAGREVVLNGATVTGGTATAGNGGNIYVGAGTDTSATLLTISNATITDGTAYNMGGNIYMVAGKTAAYGTLTVTDSTISGGKTTNDATKVGDKPTYNGGGNIYTSAVNSTYTGTTVSGGDSARFGGNILSSKGILVLGNGTVFEGGKAAGVGKSICKWNDGDLEIQAGATVKTDAQGNGDIYMDNAVVDVVATMKIAGVVEAPANFATGKGNEAVEVSGAAKVASLKLHDGLLVTVGELTDGAEIKIADAKEGMVFTKPIADGKAAEYAKYFKPATGEMGCGAVNEQLCFGTVAPCAHCDGANAVWLSYSGENAAKGGHYIVKADVTEKYQFNVKGVDTVIDLNGKTITVANCIGDPNSGSAGRIALLQADGKLSIMDSSAEQTGKIIRTFVGAETMSGGLIFGQAKSEFNLYSGTLTVAEGVAAGKGGILNSSSVVNIYGGTISGGTAAPKITVTPAEGETPEKTTYENGFGGNIYCSGKLTITGGTISGGHAYDGGNIYVTSSNDQLVDGCTVSGGVADNNGGNIYLKSDGSKVLTVGEKAVITEGQAKIGGNIYSEYYTNVYGTVSNGKASAFGGNIRNSDTLNIGKADGSVATLVTGGEAPYAGNICSVWKVNVYKGATVSNGVATTGNGGNIYIEFDHSMKSETVGETTVKKVSAVNDSVICGTVTGGKAEAGIGGNIYKTGTSHLTIGKADGSEVVQITDGKAKTAGNIYMFNGASAVKDAAAVDYAAGGMVINKGVTVSGGNSSAAGGNIGINEGKTIIICGTVSGGVAGTNGGNITGAGSSRIVVDGGTVTGGNATSTGGNLQANNGYVYLQNNAVVSNGTAGTNGGNIYTRQTTAGRKVEINGATVSGGTATAGNGGNIFVDSGANTTKSQLTISNAVISDGTALNRGGNIYIEGKSATAGELTVTDSTISGGKITNEATKTNSGSATYNGGGNIYCGYVNATFTGTTVSGGISGRFAGNILANHGNVVLANGTTFEGGVSKSVGDSISKWNSGSLEIQAGAVVKADAQGNGDIYMDNSSTNNTATLKIAGSAEVPVQFANLAGNEVLEVSGAAKIAALTLGDGILITVGELTDGAEITIVAPATGVFTNVMNPATRAADVAKYFKNTAGTQATAENGALKF